MLKNIVSVVVLFLILVPLKSMAHSQDCNNVLMQKTVHLLGTQARSKLAWMKLVNSDNYEMAKNQAAADVPGYFSGDYDSFKEKRDKLLTKEAYSLDEFEASQELRIGLPKGSVSAWRDCVIANSSGLFSWVEDIDKDAATVGLAWQPAPGLTTLDKVDPDLIGAKKDSKIFSLKNLPKGEKYFIVQRDKKNGVIRGAISGIAGVDGNYSTKIYIPPIVEVKPPPVRSLTIGACTGKGGVNGVRFWGPPSEYCNGIPAWNKYSQNTKQLSGKEKICSCIGKGGVQGVELWGPEGEPCGGMPNNVWGTYSSACVEVEDIKFCSCKGNGNVIGGMDIWGPQNNYCGGFSGWGKYASYCK